MYKALGALMFVITLIGFAIIMMLAQIISETGGGSGFSQIPGFVYFLLLAAVVISAWVFSIEDNKKSESAKDS